MCLTDVSDDPDGTSEFALSVAVVDTRRVLRARETTAREVLGEGGLVVVNLSDL
jgi:hypothetical protein